MHRALAVAQPDGLELEAEQIDGAAVESVGDEAWNGRLRKARVEDVSETVPDVGNGFRRPIDGNLAALPEVKRTYIVQAHDVVGVRMGEQDGNNSFDTRAK